MTLRAAARQGNWLPWHCWRQGFAGSSPCPGPGSGSLSPSVQGTSLAADGCWRIPWQPCKHSYPLHTLHWGELHRDGRHWLQLAHTHKHPWNRYLVHKPWLLTVRWRSAEDQLFFFWKVRNAGRPAEPPVQVTCMTPAHTARGFGPLWATSHTTTAPASWTHHSARISQVRDNCSRGWGELGLSHWWALADIVSQPKGPTELPDLSSSCASTAQHPAELTVPISLSPSTACNTRAPSQTHRECTSAASKEQWCFSLSE